jgi:predicted cupin superfamily sugar epimerase
MPASRHKPLDRVSELIRLLQLAPHPEGGHYREVFRSASHVTPGDGRDRRSALTSIDFLLSKTEFSAWHRVQSDEAWHLLEGGPLRLWCLSPSLDEVTHVNLAAASSHSAPRHTVPAGWWQAAQPLGDFALVGATVGPGFDFADFAFARDHSDVVDALRKLQPELLALVSPAQ